MSDVAETFGSSGIPGDDGSSNSGVIYSEAKKIEDVHFSDQSNVVAANPSAGSTSAAEPPANSRKNWSSKLSLKSDTAKIALLAAVIGVGAFYGYPWYQQHFGHPVLHPFSPVSHPLALANRSNQFQGATVNQNRPLQEKPVYYPGQDAASQAGGLPVQGGLNQQPVSASVQTQPGLSKVPSLVASPLVATNTPMHPATSSTNGYQILGATSAPVPRTTSPALSYSITAPASEPGAAAASVVPPAQIATPAIASGSQPVMSQAALGATVPATAKISANVVNPSVSQALTQTISVLNKSIVALQASNKSLEAENIALLAQVQQMTKEMAAMPAATASVAASVASSAKPAMAAKPAMPIVAERHLVPYAPKTTVYHPVRKAPPVVRKPYFPSVKVTSFNATNQVADIEMNGKAYKIFKGTYISGYGLVREITPTGHIIFSK